MALAICLPLSGMAQSKFGVVKINEVMDAMPEVREMTAQMETSSKKYEDEFKKLTDDFNASVAEYQKLDESTLQTVRDRRLQDIQDKQARIENFRQIAEQDLQRQQETLAAPIQEKISKAIQSVGEDGNFTFIYQAELPLYTGKDVIDVTPLVKSKLGI